MKKILLSSVATVAFAGAAAAEVTATGAATFGYNDDLENGVYIDTDIDLSLTQPLNGGWMATATFGFELNDAGDGGSLGNVTADNNYSLTIGNDMYSVQYGDIEFAAVDHWSGVTNMVQDGFSEADGEIVLRINAMYENFDASISYALDDNDGTHDPGLDQMSLGVNGSFDTFDFSVAYQEAGSHSAPGADYNPNEIFGVSVGTSFSGFDLTLAYANDNTASEDSLGIEGSYPIGPVTVGAFYVAESAGMDNYGLTASYAEGPFAADAWWHDGGDEDFGLNVSYDVGNDIMVYAGGSDDDGVYVAGEVGIGDNATLILSYAEDEDDATNDEIGPQEYLHGFTVAAKFQF